MLAKEFFEGTRQNFMSDKDLERTNRRVMSNRMDEPRDRREAQLMHALVSTSSNRNRKGNPKKGNRSYPAKERMRAIRVNAPGEL